MADTPHVHIFFLKKITYAHFPPLLFHVRPPGMVDAASRVRVETHAICLALPYCTGGPRLLISIWHGQHDGTAA